MAETRITNVVTPEVFTAYTMEPSIYRNRFFKSNILQRDAAIDSLLAGGGKTFNLPFWQDLDDTESSVPSETVAVTVSNITAEKQIARRIERNRAWGANALSAIRSGDDPMAAIRENVIGYWDRDFNKTLVSSAVGVINDNVANDSSDLVKDISNVSGGSNFSDTAVIQTQALLGENGTLGRPDQEDYVGIAVHPDVYAYMRALDLITFVPISGQPRPIPFYMNMEVIVDRRMPKTTESAGYKYTSLIFKAGAFQMGMSASGYQPTSFDRDETKGMGIDQLFTRRVYTIHPVGFAWQESSVAGVSPTNTEIETAANWSRVYEQENCRFVALIAEIPSAYQT